MRERKGKFIVDLQRSYILIIKYSLFIHGYIAVCLHAQVYDEYHVLSTVRLMAIDFRCGLLHLSLLI
jgi:hypothetical protein